MHYKKSLFIFRRDLRLDDNNGLLQTCAISDAVVPCFIFDPQQVGAKNSYRSVHALQFMIESLQDLEQQFKKTGGRLYLFHGDPEQIIKKIIKQEKINFVACNRDYTPFSKLRDTALAGICKKAGVEFKQYDDLLLQNPDTITTSQKKPYTVFTPFYNRCMQLPVDAPIHKIKQSWYTRPIASSESSALYKKILPTVHKKLFAHGGSTHGIKILKNVHNFASYTKEHDIPARAATTGLSAHLKFGTVSIRHTYHALEKSFGKKHPLIRQLYWRDFFTYIAYHFPHVFGHSFKKQYDAIPWSTNKKAFDAWCNGMTGFPFVDAGMRQLNSTGFMHNRARLVTASFLTKDLHIDWRMGERYFAQQLIDYDPAVNNGNWQWVASTGCDAQPYFRIFNPWLQQKKFDPDCIYIKQWIPELADVPSKIIHTWYKQKESINGYPISIVDHTIEAKKALAMYKKHLRY